MHAPCSGCMQQQMPCRESPLHTTPVVFAFPHHRRHCTREDPLKGKSMTNRMTSVMYAPNHILRHHPVKEADIVGSLVQKALKRKQVNNTWKAAPFVVGEKSYTHIQSPVRLGKQDATQKRRESEAWVEF
jgi:hypothetical protein